MADLKPFITALRNPLYPSVQGRFISADGTACCATAELAVQLCGAKIRNGGFHLSDPDADPDAGPSEALQAVGLPWWIFDRIVTLNDTGLSKPEIADELELLDAE